MITIIKKVYLVFYKIVEDMIYFLIVAVNIIFKIFKEIKDFARNVNTLLNLVFKKIFLQNYQLVFLRSSENDNKENLKSNSPPYSY